MINDDSTTNSKSQSLPLPLPSSCKKTNIENCEYLEVEAIVSGEDETDSEEEDEAEHEINSYDEEEEMAEYMIEKDSLATNTSEQNKLV